MHKQQGTCELTLGFFFSYLTKFSQIKRKKKENAENVVGPLNLKTFIKVG